MVRHAALAVAVAAALALPALALAKKTARGKKHAHEAEPKQPLALHLRGIDLQQRLILVEIDGTTKPPPSNYFTMTDERGRHYIAQTIHCDPPFPSGTRACELEIPIGYERHPLEKLELHRGGLHGKTVAVEPSEVRAAWAAAEQAHAPPTSESPGSGVGASGGGDGASDGGVLDSAGERTDPQK